MDESIFFLNISLKTKKYLVSEKIFTAKQGLCIFVRKKIKYIIFCDVLKVRFSLLSTF